LTGKKGPDIVVDERGRSCDRTTSSWTRTKSRGIGSGRDSWGGCRRDRWQAVGMSEPRVPCVGSAAGRRRHTKGYFAQSPVRRARRTSWVFAPSTTESTVIVYASALSTSRTESEVVVIPAILQVAE